MIRSHLRRGAVLILVLGVLSVLALLATTFATLQGVERQVARNYVDEVRARLAAESGVEGARARLKLLIANAPFPDPLQPHSRSWVYFGDQIDESQPPQVGVPLERALNPSFAYEDEKIQNPADPRTQPLRISVEGTLCGFSDIVGGSYSEAGDQYTLRVRDLSGLIFINDGLTLHGGNDSSVSQNLKRILNRLGDVVGCAALGDRIVGQRPSTGYRLRQELEPVLGSSDYRKAEPFLTTVGWTDPNVANPVPFSAAHARRLPVNYFRGSPPVYRRGRGVDAWGKPVAGEVAIGDGIEPPGASNAVYALDELFPQWIEIVSRAPVNVNSAPREVLIALLDGLQGVFVGYRRRNNISPTVGGYCIPTIIHTYSPEGGVKPLAIPVPSEGDEYGYLYSTATIKYLGKGTQTAGNAVSAAAIADELIACRSRQGKYATAPFGGPFRTWRQFNAFCDDLVRSKVIEDKRQIFHDYKLDGADVVKGGNITGYGPLVPSEYQRSLASQALADVLKANFNPNLHLNETNPDANLHLLVDKTDLTVNSTEFIFTPTGRYEIESVGRILRARDGNDARTASDNELMAIHKVVAAVRLFDLYRESSQSQFSRGKMAWAQGPQPTSSGKALEIGPEPDNGPGPEENGWDGYVALATVGGLRARKEPGELQGTPQESDVWGESIGVHFQRDFDAHVHADGIRQELAQSAMGGESVLNFPDPGETAGGPYDPVHASPGRHRLARSFRLPPTQGNGTQSLPTLFPYAPLDLRIDGGYSERHSAPAWWISPKSFIQSAREMTFVTSFWIKPSYPPDRSGKPRLMVNSIRSSGKNWVCFANDQGAQNWIGLFFNAGHEAPPPGASFPTEDTSVFGELQWKDIQQIYNGHVPIRPQSFIFARGYGPRTTTTPNPAPRIIIYNNAVVNHEGHADQRRSVFRENRWTHVTLIADRRSDEYYYGARDWFSMRRPVFNRMLINGQELPLTLEAYQNHNQGGNGQSLDGDKLLDWTRHENGDQNTIRFGTPSQFCRSPLPPRANFSCDATVDEFFLWNAKAVGENSARKQWLLGRYHKPLTAAEPGESPEAEFVSGEIQVNVSARQLPPPGVGSGPGSTTATAPERVEFLGLAWTVYGEESGDPEAGITDVRSGQKLAARVTLKLKSGSTTWGPLTKEEFSPFSAVLPSTEKVTYAALLEMEGLRESSILLTTPVLDDVTLYFAPVGGRQYEYYASIQTTLGGP